MERNLTMTITWNLYLETSIKKSMWLNTDLSFLRNIKKKGMDRSFKNE